MEVVAFGCRGGGGVPSAVEVLLFLNGVENLPAMLLSPKVQFPSPKLNGNTFGMIWTGKEMPMQNPIAAADKAVTIGLNFILSPLFPWPGNQKRYKTIAEFIKAYTRM